MSHKNVETQLKHSSVICYYKKNYRFCLQSNQTCMRLLNFQRLKFDTYNVKFK